MGVEEILPLMFAPFQLCLAHYCDLHGPTPLMVTEGIPVACTACYEHDSGSYASSVDTGDRPRTSTQSSMLPGHHATAAMSEALRRMNLAGAGAGAHRSSSLPASEQEAQAHRANLLRATTAVAATAAATSPASSSAIETPPESPRRLTENGPDAAAQMSNMARRDSSFRKTYDEYVTKRASPCENCALTLPKRQDGGGGRTDLPSADVTRGPTLRSRAPYSRVYGASGRMSLPTSQASTASDESDNGDHDDNDDVDDDRPDEEHNGNEEKRRRRRAAAVRASRSSVSSTAQSVSSHLHYLDYISTHEPVVPSSFSMVRASCLRTLSFETLPLPRGPGGGAATGLGAMVTPGASPQVPSLPGFVTTHSAGTAASGGPIFFGDPLTGYTTAYIFRIPDVHARGHKRVYAFLALSSHRERLAMKTFGFVAAAFRDLAAWILGLAEAEAERAAEGGVSPVGAGLGFGPFSPTSTTAGSERDGVDRSASGSSFLSGGSAFARRMGGGGPGMTLKQRGLAELVGLPDFFIELHRRFVALLLELGVIVGS